MKKYLLLFFTLFIFFWYNQSNATRKIDGSLIYDWNWQITECSLAPYYVWYVTPNQMLMYWGISINDVCWDNPVVPTTIQYVDQVNPLANQIWNWWISRTTGFLSWPFWYVLYFIIWISLLTSIIYAVRKWF